MVYMTRSDLERLNVLREDVRLEAEALKKLQGITPHTAEVIPLIKADMVAKRAQMEVERERVQRYVDEIKDPITRGIIEDHYLNGKPWYETAWNAAQALSTNSAWNKAMRYIYARCGLCAKKRGPRKWTVEEIVARIKAGETDLLPALWERVEGFVKKKANGFLYGHTMAYGMDFDDLCQEGFFAVLDAVKNYDPATCSCHFKSYLATVISRRYLNLVYVRPGSDIGPKNPLDRSVSLDLPVGDEDGETIADTLMDDNDPADDVLHELWLAELRETMEAALSSIKAEQAAALRSRWYGTDGGSTSKAERKAADRGLMALRKPSIYQILKGFRD